MIHEVQPPIAPPRPAVKLARPSGVETRSIDWVPPRERHGKAWHQAPFWFTGQFVVTTMALGFIGPAQGMSVPWSIAAATLGVLFGTFFMAFHANQGPTMGLPQMIQSRAQFGVRGAMVPMLAVVFVYLGLSVFGVLLVTQALALVVPGPAAAWGLLAVAASTALAVVGYELLHKVMRWLPYLAIPLFAVLTVLALTDLHPKPAAHPVTASAFLAQFTATAGYMLGYAVYVSDYSRYLPADTPARKVIGWTYLGAAASAVWLTALGALIAGSMDVVDPLLALRDVGNGWFSGFGTFAVLTTTVPVAIALMSVNFYGSMLSGLSMVGAFRPVRATVPVRVAGIVAGAGVVYLVAQFMPDSFVTNFNDFVTILLYLLVPWTAVNLCDYYWVRRGHYAIAEIFRPDGVYGRWGARGLTSYGLGVLAMVPFVSTGFYTGPLVAELDGADISFAVGLVVSGGAYLLLTRSFDPRREQAALEADPRLLAEGAAGFAREVIETDRGALAVLLRRAEPGGDAAPLLLVHPANLRASCWRATAEQLPADRTWLAVDLRGHGESPRADTYSIAAWAEDCADVLRAFGAPAAHVVGASVGAAVAVELADRHPALVASLVTVGGAFEPAGEDAYGELAQAIDVLDPGEALRRHTVEDALATPHVAPEVIADLSANDAATVTAIWLAANATDTRRAAPHLRLPILAVVGEHDRTCPPAESTRFARATGGRLELLPGVGHLPMYEAPAVLAALLAAHLLENG
ncbi:alpha/beta fold hydrolase [Embleya sp. AB8]|uniref:alpha/beta fold hydrolase n=1 Tax=Embleya sp. AB8 TaxID=3156304 RepID=UPI003C70C4DE